MLDFGSLSGSNAEVIGCWDWMKKGGSTMSLPTHFVLRGVFIVIAVALAGVASAGNCLPTVPVGWSRVTDDAMDIELHAALFGQLHPQFMFLRATGAPAGPDIEQ